ncbi:MAG: tetratricopeptide repeat protein [Bryobacteraceae bacterium]|nr:tetratricopeptide repeat protein [Bryobacteraceae bacterium]
MRKKPLAALLFVTLTACASKESARQQAIEKGNRLFEAGQFDEAEINYKRAVQADPNHSEAHYRLGLAALKLVKRDEAYRSFSRAVELLPENEDAKVRLADVALVLYTENPRRPEVLYRKAEDISSQMLKKNPDSYDGLRLQGYLRMTDNKAAEALPLLERAQAVKPGETPTMIAICRLLDQLERRKEAEDRATAYLAKHRDQQGIYDYLYVKYMSEKRTADAERIARARTDAFPKDPALALGLCAHYADLRQTAELGRCLQEVTQKHGDQASGWLMVGNFHLQFNNPAEALRAFDEGAKRPGADPVVFGKKAADALQRQAKIDEAIARLDGVLKIKADDAAGIAARARLLAATAKPDNRKQALQALQDLAGKDSQYLLDLARVRVTAKDLTGAAADLRQYVRRHTGDGYARMLLAEISDATRDHQTAFEQTEAILRVQPNNAKALLIRNRSLMGLGKLAEAKASLDGLLRKAPEDAELQVQRAFITLAEGKAADAERVFRKYYKAGSDDKRALAGLVEATLVQGRSAAAVSLIQEDIKSGAKPGLSRSLLATTAIRAGNVNLAIEQYKELLKESPQDANLHLRLGEAYQLAGNQSAAREAFGRALQLAPQSAVPHSALAMTDIAEGRVKDAEAAFRKAIQTRPEDASARNNLAYLLATTGGDLNEAEQLALEAVKRDAKNGNFSDTLGYVYLKKKNYDGAIRAFGRIVTAAPDNATYRLHLAQAYLEKGDMAKAREHLTAMQKLMLSPDEKKQVDAAMARLR